MLSLFRTNQELSGILLIPLIFLFLATAWWEFPAAVAHPAFGPLGDWMQAWAGKSPLFSTILSGVIVFIEALFLNNLIISHRMNKQINLFPGLALVIIVFSLTVFKGIPAIHLANLSLLFALVSGFSIYKKLDVAGNIFNIGLWIGLAALFYTPYIFFLIWGIFTLNSLRNISLKEPLIMISGSLVIWFLFATGYFYTDLLSDFWATTLDSFAFFDIESNIPTSVWIQLGTFVVLIFLAIASFSSYQVKKSIEAQKKISSLFYALFAAGLSVVFVPDLPIWHFLMIGIPLAVFLSFTATDLPGGLAEVLFVLILLVVLGMQYMKYLAVS
ncbi:MAG: hypothetical protein GYB31_13490 [Bacteroidetes bacterium]|nr:hypothetical protein [Bacteroidota bacterium]